MAIYLDGKKIAGRGGGSSSPKSASDITYDNTNSGLVATDTQSAIDEINTKVEGVSKGPEKVLLLSKTFTGVELSYDSVLDDTNLGNVDLFSSRSTNYHAIILQLTDVSIIRDSDTPVQLGLQHRNLGKDSSVHRLLIYDSIPPGTTNISKISILLWYDEANNYGGSLRYDGVSSTRLHLCSYEAARFTFSGKVEIYGYNLF